VESSSGRWKGEGSEKRRQANTRHREVCNTFRNVILNLIILDFYIELGTSNVFQHLHRLPDTSKATKARLEKIGQHKLGLGGYSNLVARFVSFEKPTMNTNNKLKIIFRFIAP
jgi:hypothetical protein